MTEVEEWRPVGGYEGYYEVSEFGRVRSVPRTVEDSTGRTLSLRGVVLRGSIDSAGYRRFVLNKNGRSSTLKAHRLVAFAFIGDPIEGQVVCHNDGDPLHNDYRNLRWDTPQANAVDRVVHGRTYRGGRPTISGNVRDALVARTLAGENVRHLAEEYGVSRSVIYRIERSVTGRARGITDHATCSHGHRLDGENVMYEAGTGVRRCRTCRLASYRAAYQRKKLRT